MKATFTPRDVLSSLWSKELVGYGRSLFNSQFILGGSVNIHNVRVWERYVRTKDC